jgi:hypothetical protein
MSDVPIAQPVAVAEAVIGDDTPCVNCGYNLRGLVPSGLCPECGSPISRSVYGDFLRYADPAWLTKLRQGVTLILWNMLIALCLGICGGIGAILMGRVGPLLTIAVQCVAGALEILAIWLLTAQEPRTSLNEDPMTWRKALRFCTVVTIIGQLLTQLGFTAGVGLWLTVAGHTISLAGIVAYIGKFIYLRRFALRVPDARLARSTRIVMWGMVITQTAAIVIGIVAILVFWLAGPGFAAFPGGAATRGTTTTFEFPLRSSVSPWSGMVATSAPTTSATATSGPALPPTAPSPEGIAGMIAVGVFGCGFGVAGLVFGIWYIVLLFGYRRVFGEALARQVVGQATPAR